MYAYIKSIIYFIYLKTCYQRTCAWEVTKEDSEFGNYTKSYYCHDTFIYDSVIYQAIIVALCTLIVYMMFFEEKEKIIMYEEMLKEENEILRKELTNKEKIIMFLLTYQLSEETRDYMKENINKVVEEFENLNLI
jgi:hypothetical protein